MHLKKPPVHEVVFQVDFEDPCLDYTVELSTLRQELIEDYPRIEALGASKLPLGILDPFSRHRLLSKDGKHLVHLGETVIAVNTLAHKDFEVFMNEVKKVLNVHKGMRPYSRIKKMGLRYINKLSNPTDLGQVLAFSLQNPPLGKDTNPVVFAHLFLFKEGDDSFQIQANKKEEDNFFYLDLDFFTRNLNLEYDVKSILNWAKKAHTRINDGFEKSLNPTFLKSIQ